MEPPHNLRVRGDLIQCCGVGCDKVFSSISGLVAHLQKKHLHEIPEPSTAAQTKKTSSTKPADIHVNINKDSSAIFAVVRRKVKTIFQLLRRGGASQKLCNEANAALIDLLTSVASLVAIKVNDPSSQQCANAVIKSVCDEVRTQSNQQKRATNLQSSSFYVRPVELCCGQEVKKRKHSDTQGALINEELKWYFIPTTETLKALFKNTAFRDAFYSSDHICRGGVYRGVCCGSLASTGAFSKIDDPCPIKIMLYYDEFTPTDPLKATASEHSTGAIYMKVLNLPPCLQSQ